MWDGIVNELITFFVFLYVETIGKEKREKSEDEGGEKGVWR